MLKALRNRTASYPKIISAVPASQKTRPRKTVIRQFLVSNKSVTSVLMMMANVLPFRRGPECEKSLVQRSAGQILENTGTL